MNVGFFEVSASESLFCVLAKEQIDGDIQKYTFELDWDTDKIHADSEFIFSWEMPMNGFQYLWSNFNQYDHTAGVNWGKWNHSSIAGGAPVYCYYDEAGTNYYTWALSECAKDIISKGQVSSAEGVIKFVFRIPVLQFTNCSHTEITFYLDCRKKPFYEVLGDVSKWWETECGMTPAYVPETARDSLYSFWYSHRQKITDKVVEEECRRAKEAGLTVCIVDDGWQTEDSKGGYAFCGDWKPAKNKFTDMAAHVQRVHDIGMKYVLWYSMPFVGYKSENYERFSNMLIHCEDDMGADILDPRFPEVRGFLISTYKDAVVNWNLDGLKLDFVNYWSQGNLPYRLGMDIPALTDAVDALMLEIVKTLTEIKPDILLEFRQTYTGPHMRKYGNMFRVVDCPYRYLSNRIGVFDLRLLLGSSAVHADPLVWHSDELPKNAAKQIINIMFGTLQFSARLKDMSLEMKKMSKFWIEFLAQHKKLLQEAPFSVYEPQHLYSWAKAADEKECAIAVYGNNTCVEPDAVDCIYIANGTGKDNVIVKLTGKYQVCIRDCFGNSAEEYEKEFDGVTEILVPESGLVTLKK